jgi:hypothetical protein
MRAYTINNIEETMIKKGYVWFNSQSDYDVNIVGIRNSDPGENVTNLFDDLMTISYKVHNTWVHIEWPCTTDPGKKGVLEYHNPNGVARLVPGQYRKAYQLGLHQGKYQALCQRAPVKVYRDKDKDLQFDVDSIQEGIFGINIHRSNPTTESTFVENWSEGCQVFKRVKDFQEFMKICNLAAKLQGNNFTYTLLESKDII